MSKVWVLQHARCETIGRIGDALAAAGVIADVVLTYDGQRVPPEMGEAAGLIVMGGPMGVYDYPRYPFLRDGMRLIEQAIREEKPVLGICLGSQLLATALGAPVTKGAQKEIGWLPVRLTDAATTDPLWHGVDEAFVAFHWHGDVFQVPRGAVALASSDLTDCQAFRYGPRAYGILFHMEVTAAVVADMVDAFGDELAEVGVAGHEILDGIGRHLPSLERIGARVFQEWARWFDRANV